MEYLERKIGNKLTTVSYDRFGSGEEYARKRLDEEQAHYESALDTLSKGVEEIASELEGTHIALEEVRQRTCSKCHHQSLKERRGRMRVFGGLFWTDSEPAPFKYCDNCGEEQEHNNWHPLEYQTLLYKAERTLERAERIRAKYEDVEELNKEVL